MGRQSSRYAERGAVLLFRLWRMQGRALDINHLQYCEECSAALHGFWAAPDHQGQRSHACDDAKCRFHAYGMRACRVGVAALEQLTWGSFDTGRLRSVQKDIALRSVPKK